MPASDRAYIAAACRRAGVPPFWLDDAVQDVLIKLWRSGRAECWHKLIVKRGAVQAARDYGPRSQAGISRLTVELPPSLSTRDHAEGVVNVLTRKAAFLQVWKSATANQRYWFRANLRGEGSYRAHKHASRLRRKMRALAY